MRRRVQAAPVLALSVLDLLVHGWGSMPDRPDDPDAWAAFDVRDGDVATLYRTHRAAIEAEARRCGLPQSWAATRFLE